MLVIGHLVADILINIVIYSSCWWNRTGILSVRCSYAARYSSEVWIGVVLKSLLANLQALKLTGIAETLYSW